MWQHLRKGKLKIPTEQCVNSQLLLNNSLVYAELLTVIDRLAIKPNLNRIEFFWGVFARNLYAHSRQLSIIQKLT